MRGSAFCASSESTHSCITSFLYDVIDHLGFMRLLVNWRKEEQRMNQSINQYDTGCDRSVINNFFLTNLQLRTRHGKNYIFRFLKNISCSYLPFSSKLAAHGGERDRVEGICGYLPLPIKRVELARASLRSLVFFEQFYFWM